MKSKTYQKVLNKINTVLKNDNINVFLALIVLCAVIIKGEYYAF